MITRHYIVHCDEPGCREIFLSPAQEALVHRKKNRQGLTDDERAEFEPSG